MTRILEDSGLLARELIAFHEDLSLARSIRSRFWLARGALGLLQRALPLERSLGRSPPHEARLCMELLRSSLQHTRSPAGPFLDLLDRAVAAQRPVGPWLDALHRWLPRAFDMALPGREAAQRLLQGGLDGALWFAEQTPALSGPPGLDDLCDRLARWDLDEATAIVAALPLVDREEGAARLAAARVLLGVPAESVWNFHDIPRENLRRRARFGVLRALLDRGDRPGAVDALRGLDRRVDRARAAAWIAESWAIQGATEEADELLTQHPAGPEQGAEGAESAEGLLLRARWLLDGPGAPRKRALRQAEALLDRASAGLPPLRRGERGARWDRTVPGLERPAPRVSLELLRLELALRQDPTLSLPRGLLRLAPLLRQELADSLETRRWLAARLRGVAASRWTSAGVDLVDPRERSASADQARSLLLQAPAFAQVVASPTTMTLASTLTPTLAPTTLAPTTLAPTTLAPTTLAPATLAPAAIAPAAMAPAAMALVDGVRGGGWDEARRTGRYGDARSELRAAFDEGVSMSPERHAHRRALAQVCRRVLLDGQRGVMEVTPAVVASRVRCLLQLEKLPVVKILEEALDATVRGAKNTLLLFTTLAGLAPERARACFFLRFTRLWRAAGPGLFEALGDLVELEVVGLLRAVLDHLESRPFKADGDGAGWFGRLLGGWWKARGVPPAGALLRVVLPEIRERVVLPAPEGLLLERWEQARRVAWDQEALLRELAEGPRPEEVLGRLALAGAPEPTPGWPLAAWQQVARRLLREIGEVPATLVHRWCQRLVGEGGAGSLAATLLDGSVPDGLPGELPLVSSFHLCWLDKRCDFLAFLRFADCVPCCFHSGSSAYRSRHLDTQRAVLALWKDPFSFCFQIRHKEKLNQRVEGFVFGSFGVTEEGPALLLNCMYLRRQRSLLRGAILRAIEDSWARPLGIRLIALGLRHGGRGVLPEGYVPRPGLKVRRLRALVEPGGTLACAAYDDLGLAPNQVLQSPWHLRWRSLA